MQLHCGIPSVSFALFKGECRVGADDSVGPVNVADLPWISVKMLHFVGGQSRPPLQLNSPVPTNSPKICVKPGTPCRATSPTRRTAGPPPLSGEAWVNPAAEAAFASIVPQLPADRMAGFVRFLSEICQTAEGNPAFQRTAPKIFKKFSENFQLRQEKIKRHACRIRRFVSGTLRAFCRLCRAKAEKIEQNRRTDQKKTKSQPQKREISGNAVRFRPAKRKSCLRAAPNLGRNLFAGLFSARPHALIGA